MLFQGGLFALFDTYSVREKPRLRSDFLGRETCALYKSRPIHFRLCESRQFNISPTILGEALPLRLFSLRNYIQIKFLLNNSVILSVPDSYSMRMGGHRQTSIASVVVLMIQKKANRRIRTSPLFNAVTSSSILHMDTYMNS